MGAGKAERGAAYAWNALYMCGVFFVVLVLPAAFFAGSYLPLQLNQRVSM